MQLRFELNQTSLDLVCACAGGAGDAGGDLQITNFTAL